MQDFISANTQRINKFKLALWNLVQWDQAGHYPYIYIPDNGTVESYDSPEDPEEVGSLGWIHDWCIRPVAIKKFYKYHLRGQKEVSKYSRRGRKLATLYKLKTLTTTHTVLNTLEKVLIGLGNNTLRTSLIVREPRGNFGTV